MQHFQQHFLLLSIFNQAHDYYFSCSYVVSDAKNKFQRHLKKSSKELTSDVTNTPKNDKYNTKVFESALYVIFSNKKKLLSSVINIYLTVRTGL
jgi:hypothetical protein